VRRPSRLAQVALVGNFNAQLFEAPACVNLRAVGRSPFKRDLEDGFCAVLGGPPDPEQYSVGGLELRDGFVTQDVLTPDAAHRRLELCFEQCFLKGFCSGSLGGVKGTVRVFLGLDIRQVRGYPSSVSRVWDHMTVTGFQMTAARDSTFPKMAAGRSWLVRGAWYIEFAGFQSCSGSFHFIFPSLEVIL
jgi:hypothetical protein